MNFQRLLQRGIDLNEKWRDSIISVKEEERLNEILNELFELAGSAKRPSTREKRLLLIEENLYNGNDEKRK